VCEKCGPDHGHQWGRSAVPGLLRLPRVQEYQGAPRQWNGGSDAGGNGNGESGGARASVRDLRTPMVLSAGRSGRSWPVPDIPTAGRWSSRKAPALPPEPTDQVCETCGAPWCCTGRFGRFYSCSNYPSQDVSHPIGVNCPQCGGPPRPGAPSAADFYAAPRILACAFTDVEPPRAGSMSDCGHPSWWKNAASRASRWPDQGGFEYSRNGRRGSARRQKAVSNVQ